MKRASWCSATVLGGFALLSAIQSSSSAVEARSAVGEQPATAPAHDAEGNEGCAQDLVARTSEGEMVAIPAGPYRPFYKQQGVTPTQWVDAFLVDRAPVTLANYLEFVRRRPGWQRSRVKELFAESTYLSGWANDLDPGPGSSEQPATFVSWFAAKAYCECHGKRLPTVAEWERVAAGGTNAKRETAPFDSQNQTAARSPFQFAMGRSGQEHETGLRFGEVWEWTSDFNSVLVSGRSDTGSGSSLFCGDGYRANDAEDYAGFLRHSFRASLKANYTLKNLGFRCARTL